MSGRRERWSDERLDAAFTARSAAAALPPVTLADDAVRRVKGAARTPRARFGWNLRLAGSLVAVLVVATAIGLGRSVVHTPATGSPAVSRAFAGSASDRTQRPAVSPSIVSTTLEPITVGESLTFGDANDGRELAVSGFLSPAAPIDCALIPAHSSPIAAPCAFEWFMDRPEITSIATTVPKPTGPAVRATFAFIDPPVDPARTPHGEPFAVVLVGHFVPSRTGAICATRPVPDPLDPCKANFAVDQVRSVRGQKKPVATVDRRATLDSSGKRVDAPNSSAAMIDSHVAAASGGEEVLSRALFTGMQVAAFGSGVQDPVARFGAGQPLDGAETVWVVTSLGSNDGQPTAHVWLIADGSSSVARLTADGRVSLTLPTSRPDQTVLCGRLDLDRCAAAIAVVRAFARNDVDGSSTIAVDDVCAPTVSCDRRFPFDSAVVLVADSGNVAGAQAYEVTGLGQEPEEAMPWSGSLPPHILAMLPLPTPSPVAWGAQVPTPAPEAIATRPTLPSREGYTTLVPVSPTGAQIGVPYGYDLPWCGDAIDVDGSFWDIVRGSEGFHGDHGTFRLESMDRAIFTASAGGVLELARHIGPKEFAICS